MFTFAQPPLAMAAKIWEFQHKISCNWGYIRGYNLQCKSGQFFFAE